MTTFLISLTTIGRLGGWLNSGQKFNGTGCRVLHGCLPCNQDHDVTKKSVLYIQQTTWTMVHHFVPQLATCLHVSRSHGQVAHPLGKRAMICLAKARPPSGAFTNLQHNARVLTNLHKVNTLLTFHLRGARYVCAIDILSHWW